MASASLVLFGAAAVFSCNASCLSAGSGSLTSLGCPGLVSSLLPAPQILFESGFPAPS